MPKKIDDKQVYRTTLQLFSERGYDNMSTKDIAAAANIHETTIFRKYGSKDELLKQAFNNLLEDVPFTHLQYTGNLEVDLAAIVEAYLKTVQQHGEVFLALLFHVKYNAEMYDTFDIIWNNAQNPMTIIQRYQESKSLSEGSTVSLLFELLGPLMIQQILLRTIPAYPNSPISVESLEIAPQVYVHRFLYGHSCPK